MGSGGFVYLGNGTSMEHITTVEHIQVGDVLKLRSNDRTSLQQIRRLRIIIHGFIPTQDYETRPDPDFVMDDPDRRERREIAVPTNTGIHVIAITSFWIMVDFWGWYGRDTVEYSNVIISKGNFESMFLRQGGWELLMRAKGSYEQACHPSTRVVLRLPRL